MISFSVVLSLAGVRPRVSRQSSSSAGAGRGKRIDAYVRVSTGYVLSTKEAF